MGNNSSASSSRSNSSEESSPEEIQINDPVISNETVTNPPQIDILNTEQTQHDEEEDLITCGVCWNQFDGDVHKPKFLACHHTFCLQCLQEMGKNKATIIIFVTCPLCRHETTCREIGNLRDNIYVLQIINYISKQNQSKVSNDDRWCLECKKMECNHPNHPTLSMGSDGTIQEALTLQELIGTSQERLKTVLNKREYLDKDLINVSRALEVLQLKIQKQKSDNNERMDEIGQMLTTHNLKSIIQEETVHSLTVKLLETFFPKIEREEELLLDHSTEITEISNGVFSNFADQFE